MQTRRRRCETCWTRQWRTTHRRSSAGRPGALRPSRTARRRGRTSRRQSTTQPDLFADFNGLPDGDAKTEFYQHDANWSNRMILGDSLQVMASLAEREGLRG